MLKRFSHTLVRWQLEHKGYVCLNYDAPDKIPEHQLGEIADVFITEVAGINFVPGVPSSCRPTYVVKEFIERKVLLYVENVFLSFRYHVDQEEQNVVQ